MDITSAKKKAAEIHENAKTLFPLVPKSDTTKLLVREAITQLNTILHTAEVFRAEMNHLASQLPEYEAVMGMTGVEPSVGPQLMAEISDIRRFAQKNSLVAFTDIDPGRNDSGSKESNKGRTNKRGSPHLRKILFVIMSILLQVKPDDDPVYQFLDKKRSEGKPFYVYMTTGGTKFLRIYYGRVREPLIKSRLAAWHASRLHLFRHSAQLSLAESQDHKWSDWLRSVELALPTLVHSDEKPGELIED